MKTFLSLPAHLYSPLVGNQYYILNYILFPYLPHNKRIPKKMETWANRVQIEAKYKKAPKGRNP
jgi:hypothetical protein